MDNRVYFLTDQFEEDKDSAVSNRDYYHTTVGLFAQNNWDISDIFSLETSLRGDYQHEYGFFLLPRLSALFILNPRVTARLGGGLVIKPPVYFSAQRSPANGYAVMQSGQDFSAGCDSQSQKGYAGLY
jgi:outer membrane receptor for ferrienterochelin and colicins